MFSCYEKNQIQLLDRTQSGLPSKKGRATTIHDYKRHDITTFFAALNVLDGAVTGGQCQTRHGHTESLKFLRQIE